LHFGNEWKAENDASAPEPDSRAVYGVALRRETNDDAEFDSFAFHFQNVLILRTGPCDLKN
jgi:hypothetical protein